MQRRWNIAAEMFRKAHQRRVIKDLFSNLNHLGNILTSQLAIFAKHGRRKTKP